MKKLQLSLIAIATFFTLLQASPPEQRAASVQKAIQSVTEQEQKELGVVENFKHMFEDAQVSGNIRIMYSGYNNYRDTNTYATALGGQLKYELAKYKGFNGGVALVTSNDISFASGDKAKRNEELSSTKGSYSELTQAYINYEFEGLNLRAGRQLIDTPLADSDDIRMVPNTFEAYILSYELNDFSYMVGHLNQWQGSDTGLDVDNAWVKTGKDGVNFGGVTYSDEIVEANAWYYNISNGSDANNAIYLDIVGSYIFNDTFDLHIGAQYLNESELDNSGVKANIYGVMAELIVKDLGLNIAYNKSTKQAGRHSFSGYGGGTLFTNMDTMILDEITQDRESQAIVTGFVYKFNDFNFLYAYGNFIGDADSSGKKEYVVEQNIGLEFSPNDNFTFATIYVKNEDRTSRDFNNDNLRVLVSYNFI